MTFRISIPGLLLALLLFAAPSPGGVLQAQELEWATSARTTIEIPVGHPSGDSSGESIATDALGNSYVTGEFRGPVTFGAGEANETVLIAAGFPNLSDMYIAKYALDGTLLWVKSAGVSGTSKPLESVTGVTRSHIATDPSGNSYVTGSSLGSATFGEGEANETVLTGHGLFVAKYAPDGILQWARSLGEGTGGGGYGGAIATDTVGNSYVTGTFCCGVAFGNGETDETVLATPTAGVFVAKYAADGSLLWATGSGGTDVDPVAPLVSSEGSAIVTDPSGNSYVTGVYVPPLTLGAGEANETVLTTPGYAGIFIAKYAPDGTLLWARSAGGGEIQYWGVGIATDPSGNSYLTGYFEGMAIFGAGETNETVLIAAGSGDLDMFVAKYAPDGDFLWATSAGGNGEDVGMGIATDGRGATYVTGGFSSPATFGAGEDNEMVLTTAGSFDGFVAKYAPDGTFVWATSVGDRALLWATASRPTAAAASTSPA